EVKFEDLILETEDEITYDLARNKLEYCDEDNEEKIEANISKNLYRINIKGELVYIFIEDLETLGELNELIISKFINTDVNEMLKIANQDRS
ncbi:MAG: hypothetical protein WBA54_02260, partial [Acidaminobacteraceae bacterium]